PIPRKLNAATDTNPIPIVFANTMEIDGSNLFQTCLRMVQPSRPPASTAASTYGVLDICKVTARATRKNNGEVKNPTANIDGIMLLPNNALIATVKISNSS